MMEQHHGPRNEPRTVHMQMPKANTYHVKPPRLWSWPGHRCYNLHVDITAKQTKMLKILLSSIHHCFICTWSFLFNGSAASRE